MRHAIRGALAGLGLAGLLLTGAAATAHADPAATPAPTTPAPGAATATGAPGTPSEPGTPRAPGTRPAVTPSAEPTSVDLQTRLFLDYHQVAPGRNFGFDSNTGPKDDTGADTFRDFQLVVRLPKGMTYVATGNDMCKATPDPQTMTCPSFPTLGHPPLAGDSFDIKVSDDVPDGTVLTITCTAEFTKPGVTDPHPADNVMTGSILVKRGSDWSVRWEAPKVVQPGPDVFATTLVITNPGPDTDTGGFRFLIGPKNIPSGVRFAAPMPNGCEADSGEWDCDLPTALGPGQTATFTWLWTADASARGKTLDLPMNFAPGNSTSDPNPANNSAELKVKVASKPGSVTGGSSAGSSGGGHGSGGASSSGGTSGTGGASSAGGTSGTTGSTTTGTTGTSGTSTTGGSLAATGSSGTQPILYAAGAIIVLGSGLVLFVRIRRGRQG